jgi:hypothetical protein
MSATECAHCIVDSKPPPFVLVREPDQLGVDRAHPQLAFGVRVIQFAEPHCHGSGAFARIHEG